MGWAWCFLRGLGWEDLVGCGRLGLVAIGCVDWWLGTAGVVWDRCSWYVFGGVDLAELGGWGGHWMGGLGLGLVAIGGLDLVGLGGWGGILDGQLEIGVGHSQGVALAGSGILSGSSGDEASCFDVADARTMSSGESFLSLSSGLFYVASLVGGSLVFGVSVNDGVSFYKQQPHVCCCSRRQSLLLSMAEMVLASMGDSGTFGSGSSNNNDRLVAGVLYGGSCFSLEP